MEKRNYVTDPKQSYFVITAYAYSVMFEIWFKLHQSSYLQMSSYPECCFRSYELKFIAKTWGSIYRKSLSSNVCQTIDIIWTLPVLAIWTNSGTLHTFFNFQIILIRYWTIWCESDFPLGFRHNSYEYNCLARDWDSIFCQKIDPQFFQNELASYELNANLPFNSCRVHFTYFIFQLIRYWNIQPHFDFTLDLTSQSICRQLWGIIESHFLSKIDYQFFPNNWFHMNWNIILCNECLAAQFRLLEFGNISRTYRFMRWSRPQMAKSVAIHVKAIELPKIETQFFPKKLSFKYWESISSHMSCNCICRLQTPFTYSVKLIPCSTHDLCNVLYRRPFP